MSILESRLREDEREFLIEYRQLEKLDREKEIKFFSCIGDPSITEPEVINHEEQRVDKILSK
jgi:hypothetical protein